MLVGSGSSYTLDLSTVTTTAGSYVLTLTASGSGIIDNVGNALTADASDSFLIDLTAPAADIVDVTPDPRNAAVGLVTLSFSESVTGLDIGDLSLTRDGNAVTLTAGMLVGSGTSYTLDLSTVTTTAGSYVLTLTASGSGIIDSAGNPLAADASDSFLIDLTAPIGRHRGRDARSAERRSGSGDAELQRERDGPGHRGPESDAGRERGHADGWRCRAAAGPATRSIWRAVTTTAGSYVLTLTASGSGITDSAGNLLAADATDSWVVDTSLPSADIVDVTPDPRNAAVGLVTLSFSESVTGLDIGDLSLTRDGNPVTLTAGMLVGSGSSYTLDLATVTTAAGSYVLTLTASGSGIMDSAGNLLAADATDSWSSNQTAPRPTSWT